jgi:hypothetical protein
VDLVIKPEAEAARAGRLAEHMMRLGFFVPGELGHLPFVQPGGQLARLGDCPLRGRLVRLTPRNTEASECELEGTLGEGWAVPDLEIHNIYAKSVNGVTAEPKPR